MDAETLNYILMALFAGSEILGQIESVKSNNIFQLVTTVLKFVVRK